MGDYKGDRVRSPAPLVDEVDLDVLHLGPEVVEGIDSLFLGSPIKLRGPIVHQLLDIIQVGPVVPLGAWDFAGPACSGQTLAQVLQGGFRYVDLKRLHVHAGLLQISREIRRIWRILPRVVPMLNL